MNLRISTSEFAASDAGFVSIWIPPDGMTQEFANSPLIRVFQG
jgi:hypothetical protein